MTYRASFMVIVMGIVHAMSACGPSQPEQPTTPTPQPAAAAPEAVKPPPPPPEPLKVGGFDAVDMYGTEQISIGDVAAKHAPLIEALAAAFQKQDGEAVDKARQELVSAIEQMGQFAYVKPSVISYHGEMQGMYLTIDVVDEKDREVRLRFAKEPDFTAKDPDGLLAAWAEYEQKGFALLRKGELDRNAAEAECPALHCAFGFSHPDLAPYAKVFNAKVPKAKGKLVLLLGSDKDAQKRAHAAFLLGHITDPNELVQLMLPSFRDSSSLVRNNAMRVVVHVATHHKDAEVPVGPVIDALYFPDTTDRNKAAYILLALADKPKNHPIIVKEAGVPLLAMLEMWQPNNHNPAYQILVKVSGKDFGERDYQAWQHWLSSAQ